MGCSRRLHHAGKGNSVRPFIRGNEEPSCVIRAHCASDELQYLLSRLSVEMIGSSKFLSRPDSRPQAGAMASLNRACRARPPLGCPTSTRDSRHPSFHSKRLGKKLDRCTKKALAKKVGSPATRVAPARFLCRPSIGSGVADGHSLIGGDRPTPSTARMPHGLIRLSYYFL